MSPIKDSKNKPEAEYMIDYESGVRYNSGKLSINVNGFYMDYKSQLILTGKINDVGEYIRESVTKSYREGVEMDWSIKLSSKINLLANICLSRNRVKLYREYVDDYDGGPQVTNEYKNTTISFSPDLTGAAIISIVPINNFSIELTGKYVGKQYLDNTTNETRNLDPYFINDLHLSYVIHPKKIKEISFQFSLNNFLNRKYISNGYTYSGFRGGIRYDYNNYFPQAMVNFLGGVVVKI